MKKSLLWTSVISAMAVGMTANAAERVALSNVNIELDQLAKNGTVGTQSLKKHFKLSKDHSFSKISEKSDFKGNQHKRIQQSYKGVRVFGQQVTQHSKVKLGKDYFAGHVITDIDKDLKGNVTPKLSTTDVIASLKSKVESKFGKWTNYERENTELVVYFDERFNKAFLAYHVELMAQDEKGHVVRRMFIVDANSDRIIKHWNALQHFDITGPGGNEKTGQYQYGTDYPALDGTDDGNGGTCYLENANVRAVDLANTTNTSNNTPYEFACSENTYKAINGAYSPINDAFYFGNVAFDMFDEWYQTAPLPFQLSMKVHYGNGYENAFWDGQAMTFGDGASTFYPLVDINVSVHEISHGFTDFNSDLIYSGESGGMNEAFSDIAGEAGEYFWKGSVDWFIGGDIMKNGDGLRFFETPSLDGRSIDHFDDYYSGMDVHYSSGVYNRGYYLLSNMEGWDPRKAFDIFVHANQNYWTPSSTMAEGACGLIESATDLEYDWISVYVAMSAVGAVCENSSTDTDNDTMSDISEIIIGFDFEDPADANADFDGDGIINKVEMLKGFDPKDTDSDDDGLSDDEEYNLYATDVINADTDADGMPDGYEVANGFNPLNDNDAMQDADSDGVSNVGEYLDGTDPNDANSVRMPPAYSLYDFEDQSVADFPISIYADYPLEISSTYAASGMYSLASPDMTHNEWGGSDITFVSEEGTMSFDLKISTESGWDYFYLAIDGALAFELSGEYDWVTISGPIAAGQHTISFIYAKDGSVSSGEDKIWVDNFYYPGYVRDDDADGMDDAWETNNGLNPADNADAALDADNDGLTNLEEYQAGSNPNVADTDSDGLTDSEEVDTHMTNPAAWDTDGDGVSDKDEVDNGLDPLVAGTDGEDDLDNDGFINRTESKYGSDLNDASSMPAAVAYLVESFNDGNTQAEWTSSTPESFSIQNGRLYSEPLSNDKVASIEVTDVFMAGELSFKANVDTEENVDKMRLLIDGVVVSELTGQLNDQTVTAALTQGEHTIRLEYVKNAFMSSKVDRVSIDNLMYLAPDVDSDGDGLSNGEEVNTYGTDPMSTDSDGDGIADGAEVAAGTNPAKRDTDNDGVADGDDLFPTDASRWSNSDSGSAYFLLLMMAAFAGLRRRK